MIHMAYYFCMQSAADASRVDSGRGFCVGFTRARGEHSMAGTWARASLRSKPCFRMAREDGWREKKLALMLRVCLAKFF